ncbi:MAG: alkaline phosphatase family protein [Terracidiphilus sp.]
MKNFFAAALATSLLAGAARIPVHPAVHAAAPSDGQPTATPIKHLVIIYQENVSFDHYFATYPHAKNLPGEPAFFARPGTPSVNGLTGLLLSNNPNASNPINGDGATNPFRLDRSQAATADQDHSYTPEQAAFDFGLMDAFPHSVGAGDPARSGHPLATRGLTMGYYDGNTVTALWNYAQRYAMSDNSYGTTFGPSTPGAINLISGQTNGILQDVNSGGAVIDDGNGGLTLISDPDPLGDKCSGTTGELVQFAGKNLGDLLNERGISWGFFEGGFNLGTVNANKTTGCDRNTRSAVTGVTSRDYLPHHEPFQYYTSTANPTHTRPTSPFTVGLAGDPANHQYDLQDFFAAVSAGNFPSVSYLKAPAYQDGHAGYSDPLDEQSFLVNTINFLEKRPEWSSTAVIIAYDDSDGWYDHAFGPIVNQSATAADIIRGRPSCGSGASALPGVNANTAHAQGRCGYGPRLVLLVVSPYARQNFVDHSLTDQTSILRFVEDNWLDGERLGGGSFDALANPLDNMFDFTPSRNAAAPFLLDPQTGLVLRDQPSAFPYGK